MRAENQRMKKFLKDNGIDAMPKYLSTGSLRGCWRIYGKEDWFNNPTLIETLNNLGFVDFTGRPLDKFSGNSGMFSIFARLANKQIQQILYDGVSQL